MGTLGVQEMIVVFIVALVLFGPKKLPELGRTIAKAITEFRRASNDLKATFEREMQNLERETESLHRSAEQTALSVFDHAAPLEHVESEPALISAGSAPVTPSIVGASEVPGAESNGASETAALHTESATELSPEASPAPAQAIDGTVPRSVQPAPLAEIAQETAHESAPVEIHAAAETPRHS